MDGSERRFSASQAPRRLERRLASLRTVEWLNVGWLAFVLLWWIPTSGDAAIPAATWQRTAVYALSATLLGVGGWYWHRKLQQVRDGRPLDDALVVLDRADRWFPSLLLVTAGALAVSWLTGAGSTGDRVWASILFVFACAEYVNYFRLQLMHDTRSDLARLLRTRRLRRSWLACDLARWRTDRRPHATSGHTPHR